MPVHRDDPLTSYLLIFIYFFLQTGHIANNSTVLPSASSPKLEGCYVNILATKLALYQKDRSLGS